MATGDLDNDGFEDIIIGAAFGKSPVLLFQQASGKFIQKNLLPAGINKDWEAVNIALFDADGDKDLDMYIACGSNAAEPGSAAYQNKLMIKDESGNFTADTSAPPQNHTSKSCLRVEDFDEDGDLVLSIGGRCSPWKHPEPVSSFLLRNNSKNGKAKFADVTGAIAGGLANIGMACDAVWSDFDKDGWTDILVAGEWMPLKLLKNDHGKFIDVSPASGINNKSGWWSNNTKGNF